MSEQHLDEVLKELAAQQKSVAEALERGAKKEKDSWDKFSALSTFLSTVIIALIGSVFTFVYNLNESNRNRILKEQEMRVSRIQTLEKFIPHLNGSEQEKRLAILAISSLGDAELATKLAALYPSEGTVAALKDIATSGQKAERDLANKALQGIFDQQRKAVVQFAVDSPEHQAYASGAIVSAAGHVITADYVVSAFGKEGHKTKIPVTTADKLVHEATVLGLDKRRGLAVLKIADSSTPALQLSNSQVKPGDSVLAIGTRGKLSLEPAIGIVQDMDERFVNVAFSNKIAGFGGGPVLNREGMLIAIVYSFKSGATGAEVDRCIRSDVIRDYLAELKVESLTK
jgi:hypothetical protein